MYIVELKTVQSSAIRILIEVLKDVLNDITLTFDESGLHITAIDGSHIAVINLVLYGENFEHYVCKQKIDVGLCITSLYKLVRTVTNNDVFSIYIEEDNTDHLIIQIENSDKNSMTKFKLKLLDLDNKTINIPKVDMECILTMPSNDFQRLCRDMMNISDFVKLTTQDDKIIFSCDGDFASQETEIKEATHGLVFNTKCETTIEGKFSLKYLNMFTKSTNLCNTIELNLKKNFPLILKYNVANLGFIKFCLAAKA